MTKEEKAKAYDEALERAKTSFESANGMILKKWLVGIFPELKESEDEKIRKDLIAIFKGEIPYTSEEDAKRYIAWLEKQGEQKASYTTIVETGNGGINALVTKEFYVDKKELYVDKTEQKPTWSEEDEGYMDRILEALYDYYPKRYAQSIYDWLLNSLKKV